MIRVEKHERFSKCGSVLKIENPNPKAYSHTSNKFKSKTLMASVFLLSSSFECRFNPILLCFCVSIEFYCYLNFFCPLSHVLIFLTNLFFSPPEHLKIRPGSLQSLIGACSRTFSAKMNRFRNEEFVRDAAEL